MGKYALLLIIVILLLVAIGSFVIPNIINYASYFTN
ncbi:hypothetical protein SAMN04487776_12112 [Priestia megaterium]|nr:hypothetical protein SAMN04487776_12112 [Priestia megaterium]